ncbi:TerD family protein [Streptomyces resistomycificus]|uniref:TerD-family protein n=1 Tax=Streptomyces resistomycificus TaxID=67356 RepID=A0A0L8KZB1_9ACTN|nr:TerD family protein [Streptomyces resistomycificus]KOG31129.1 TerD-family protein [Streptomyces resistomycificus]KUO02100.1 TerD-family protein [Streptomyces resistomycificus]
MSGDSQGVGKVEIRLKWDPSPWEQPSHHLDIIATTYSADAPYGRPVYVVHFDSRSPDGTINMSRHSQTGQGLGYVEVMTVELDRLASSFARVVVGVAIHQNSGPKTFGDMSNAGVLVVERYKELLKDDLTQVSGSTAATVAEFTRDASGAWEFHELVRGFDSDPVVFTTEMGRAPRP